MPSGVEMKSAHPCLSANAGRITWNHTSESIKAAASKTTPAKLRPLSVVAFSVPFNSISEPFISSIFKSVSYLRFIILPFVIVYMIAKVNKKKFVIFINFLIILLIFDVFFQFYFKFDIFGYNLGVVNFNIGKNLTMFNINGIDFASMICLESIFPNPTRSFVNEGAKFLVYIVNDGWYIKPPEPQQHAKRCVYRAIENRRTVLRSANTGISMVVNPFGNITNYLELNKSGLINAQIGILDKITFYTKYGNLFSIFNILIINL